MIVNSTLYRMRRSMLDHMDVLNRISQNGRLLDLKLVLYRLKVARP